MLPGARRHPCSRLIPTRADESVRSELPQEGLTLLLAQAALAFELFFGEAPPRDDDAALRALLLR